MKLEYHLPFPLLRPYIKLYAWYSVKKEEIMERIKFLPMGYVYLVMNLNGPFVIQRPDISVTRASNATILVGQQETFYNLLPHGELVSFSVIFQPTGMKRLLNVPVQELRCYGYQAELILKNQLTPLHEQLSSAQPNVSKMVEHTDNFFLRLLHTAYSDYPYIDKVLDCIRISQGLTHLKELTHLTNMSGRTFRRRFLEMTGTSCIKYITITRFKHILHALKCNNASFLNWSKVACSVGYYDQMHFIKSFKMLAGETPTGYLSRYNNPENILERYFMAAID